MFYIPQNYSNHSGQSLPYFLLPVTVSRQSIFFTDVRFFEDLRILYVMNSLIIYKSSYHPNVSLGRPARIQLQMENPEPFLLDLHGKMISVMLKWGW